MGVWSCAKFDFGMNCQWILLGENWFVLDSIQVLHGSCGIMHVIVVINLPILCNIS